MNKKIYPLLLLGFILMAGGCKKENLYIYEVNDIEITTPGSEKPNIKTDEEFISIAYTDIFGATIPNPDLEDLQLAYSGYGDKRMIIDMIIRNFLNDPAASIPTTAEMQADPVTFVEETFRKFLVRDPNEFEKWYYVDLIEADDTVTPN